MSVDSQLIADYREVLRDLSHQASVSRRASKNEAILRYVMGLHSIWLSWSTDSPDEMRQSYIAKMLSKSVSMLLSPCLDRLGKAILSERAPHFQPTDDGDDLGDDFTSMVLTRYHQLESELSDPSSRDLELKTARCLEDVRAAILREFDRQSLTSWTP